MTNRIAAFSSSVVKIVAAIVVAGAAAAFLYFLAIFTMAMFIFDRGPCDDTHKSVALMRSMSQDELAGLYDRVMGLWTQHAYGQLRRGGDNPIPEDLAYLKASRIWFGGPADDVQITLTKCNVSVGIILEFTNGEYGPKRIELNWHKMSPDYPYEQATEVLWPA